MRWLIQLSIAATVSASVFVALATLSPAGFSPLESRDSSGESEARLPRPAGEARIFADGLVEGAGREIAPRFEMPGRIKLVHVREGATVKAGDVLAEQESDIAELQLAAAQTRLKIATAERDRMLSGLGASGGRKVAPVSSEDIVIAEGKVTLAELEVRRERLLLDKLRLRSPIDGVVLHVAATPGEFAGPTGERDLFTVVDRSATRVRAFVEELDGLRVSPGQRALVTAAARPGKSYQGTVRACAPGFRPKLQHRLRPGERLDIRVREVVIDLEDVTDLLVGLPVEVFIEP
jgi:HlyD family secretion protein